MSTNFNNNNDINGHVYLITELDSEQFYKIGVTKHKNINKRKDELQTGNSSELMIIKYFPTKYPYKLERMLHTYYTSKNKINEWYELSEEDINDFINRCQIYENSFNALTDNLFFD